MSKAVPLKFYLAPLLGAGLVAVLAALGWLAYMVVSDTTDLDHYVPASEQVTRAHSELAQGHLWLEEAISGDPQVEIDQVWALLSSARARLTNLIQEVAVWEPAQPDRAITRAVAQGLAHLEQLMAVSEELAKQRWAQREASTIGSPADQEQDRIFNEVLTLAGLIQADLQEMIARVRARHQEAQGRIMGLWGVLVMIGLGGVTWLTGWARRSQQERERQRELMAAVLNHTDNAMVALDQKRRLLWYNRQYLELWDFPPGFPGPQTTVDDVIRNLCERGIYDPDRAEEYIARRIQHLDQSHCEPVLETPRRDGVVVEARACPLPGVGHLIWFRDVTQERQALQALRDSERRFRLAMEAAPDPVVVYDPDGRVVFLNRAFTRVFGWGLAEAAGRRLDFIPASRREETRAALAQVLAGESLQGFDTARLTKSGRELAVSLSAGVFTDGRGQTLGLVVHLRDETERIKARGMVEESRRMLRAVMDNVPPAIFWKDPDGVYQGCNQAFARLLDLASPQAVVGLTDQDLPWRKADAMRFLDQERQVAVGRAPQVESQEEVSLPDGRRRWLEISRLPLLDEEGGVTGILGVMLDISERVATLEELARHRSRLEELVEERTTELQKAHQELIQAERLSVLGRLTATVSHELRNPLGVIRGSVFYLARQLSPAEGKVAKHLARIDQEVARCDRIVGELLVYTRGSISAFAPTAPGPWLRETVERLALPPWLEVGVELGERLPTVNLDADKMRRVVDNLALNAVQALQGPEGDPPPGRPRLEFAVASRGRRVVFSVRDNGPGMDQKTLKKAWEPLFTTKARGTGLGLAIVSKLVKEHGGDVSLQSRPGRGTLVEVVLPALQEAEPSSETGAEAAL